MLAVLALGAGLAGCGDDGGDDGASGGGGGDKEAFCQLAAEEDVDGLEDFDPNEAADMEELNRLLDELSDRAPSEIRDDVETVAEGLREFVEVLSTIDTSDPNALAELGERAEELEGMQEEMEAATERVDRYLEEECGIDPES